MRLINGLVLPGRLHFGEGEKGKGRVTPCYFDSRDT